MLVINRFFRISINSNVNWISYYNYFHYDGIYLPLRKKIMIANLKYHDVTVMFL